MKGTEGKKVIHIAKHFPTGAEIPIQIHKIGKGNIIEDFREVPTGRKCFSLDMLSDRWGLDRQCVLDLLEKYQVPLHMRPEDAELLHRLREMDEDIHQDHTVVFEEYIIAMEKKGKIPHKKLKPRPFQLNPLN